VESDQGIPGNLSIKTNSSPANCHPRNSMNSVVPMQIATLTDVGKKVGGGSADACAHAKASGSEHELTPGDQPPTEFAANGKGERPAPSCRIHPERLSELVKAADWTQIGKSPTRNDLREVQAWEEDLGLSHSD